MNCNNLASTFENIATAIRSKTGKSAKLCPSEMASEIMTIEKGEADFTYYDGSATVTTN